MTASLAQSDSNVSCTAVSGVPAQSAAAGSYPISASCSSDNYTASGSAVYEVTAVDVVFTLDGDTVGVAGSDPETWSYFTATTANPNGITLGEQLVVDIAIERGGGIAAGDVVLEVEPWGAPGTWVDIGLTLDGDLLTGSFGPYSLDPDSSTANLRARVARGGRYNVVATAAGVSSDATYASATHAVDVAQLGLSGSGNINGVVGTAVEGAYSLVNSGTADLGTHMPAPNDENVRGRFFIEGPVALTGASVPGCGNEACTSPDVAVEFFNPLTNAYQRIYNLRAELDEFNVPTGRLFGHFGALASGGQPVPAGATGTFLFRTTFLQHTGTYTVTSQVVGIDSGKVYAEAVPQTIGIGTGTAATIELVGGDAGEAVVGGNTYDNGDLVVRVLDAGGNPVAGAAVAFNVHAGSNGAGASFAAPDLTDSNGETAVAALSNAVAGDFTVTASIGIGIDQSVEFVLRNVADDASQLHLMSGSGQTASLNQPFALPLVVRVTDQYGNPVAGELVDFLAPATGASAGLSTPADPTDTNGETFVLALANGLPGSYVVEAGAGYGSVDFGLTNTAATADMLALAVVGSDEAVVASGSYTLQATVTGSGNAVPGVSVTFVVEPGSNGAGATTSNAVAITDINGVATATFNANTVAGGFVVRAVVSGVLPDADDVAMLTNLADAATTLTMVSGSPQSAAVNSAFAQPLVVRASDIHGNPIAGAIVGFTVNGATASATLDPVDGTVVTDADGTAAVTAEANGIAGSYSATALAAFGSPVDFALENTVGNVIISDIVWAASSATTVAYDGASKAATATVTGSSATPVFTYNGSSSEPVNAGTYLVIATVDDGNVFGSASTMLTITPAEAGNTGILLGGGSFVYDGVAKPATVTNPNGVAFTLVYDTGNGLAPVNVGSYTAMLTVTDPNHAPQVLTAAIEITAAEVELVFGNLNHVYDGTAKAATVTTSPAGVAGVSLAYSPDVAPTNAGSYTVTATLANPNYVLTGATTAELVIAKATAQIFLSNLTQVYDGSVKAATVVTVPASLAADVDVSYTPTNPVNIGSYAVLAVLEGHPNYADVSANATLTIIAATIAGFEIVGDDSFTGIAGAALAGALPTVRVFDTSDQGVAGISIHFSVTAGNGSIEGAGSAYVPTDANGLATVPEWVLGAVAGGNTMTATTSLPGLPTLVFNAIGTQQADVSIDKSVDLAQAHAGQVLTWTIVVENAGPSTADVELADALPDGLTSITWICEAVGDAVCGEADGVGDILFTSTIPADGGITIVVSATVANDAAIGTMTNEASATWGDSGAVTDSASTNIVPAETGPCSIFCDGFEDEPGSTALVLPGEDARAAGWILHPSGSDKPGVALELLDASGKAMAWLDTLKAGNTQLVRLRHRSADGIERASAWSRWNGGDVLGYGWDLSVDGLVLRFTPVSGHAGSLELHLPGGAAIPERVRPLRASAR
ncbi:MBG domain-containing protein [Xanthomonadaceae bacterium JHOS43]|nr:MBG domain-containing protein [Xanthomonadaceae bacterium JHOS43]